MSEYYIITDAVTVSGNAIVGALLDNMVARDSMWKYWYNTLY